MNTPGTSLGFAVSKRRHHCRALSAGKQYAIAWPVLPATMLWGKPGIDDRPQTSGVCGNSNRSFSNLKPQWISRCWFGQACLPQLCACCLQGHLTIVLLRHAAPQACTAIQTQARRRRICRSKTVNFCYKMQLSAVSRTNKLSLFQMALRRQTQRRLCVVQQKLLKLLSQRPRKQQP